MGIMLGGKELWEYRTGGERIHSFGIETDDDYKQDLALAYILTSVDSTYKAMIRTVGRFPETCKVFIQLFQSVSEAEIDAKIILATGHFIKERGNIVE